jgi:hypothetical protein
LTPSDLQHLVETQVTVPLMTALEAFGMGETSGRAALKRGDLPFRVWRVGKVLRVPTMDLAVLLLAPVEAA